MDKAKKKRLKQYIAWISLAALVAVLAAMPLLARSEQEEGPVASILEAAVQLGDLETGLYTGGTLSAGEAMDVELPSGVKITEFLVKNGDIVSEGDPVAAVDRVSVMTAILGVRDTLDYLQEEMANAEDETVSASVKATAGGRIKQVFAQAGDRVQDVMLEHGALAVLSLDNMMAVSLEGNWMLAAGDSVTVGFSEGTEVPGRVESNLDGILTVTVNDENYDVGAPVTLTRGEETLGTGTLYVHNAWKAMAFTGTVSAVSARVNTDVYDGATLFTLKDTAFRGTLEGLAGLHREYEQLLQRLFAMHESGFVTAPCDGQVSGVDSDSPFLLSALEGEAGWFTDLLDGPREESGWTVMLLSNTRTLCTEDDACQARTHEEGCPMKCTGQEGCTAGNHEEGCAVYCTGLSDCGNLHHKTGCLGVCTGNSLCKSTREAKFHQTSCVKRCISDQDEDPGTLCDAQVHYPGCIENCTQSEGCSALIHKSDCPGYGVTYTALAVQVRLVSLEGLQVIPGAVTYQVSPEKEGWKLISPDQLETVFVGEAQLLQLSDGATYQAGDILLMVTGSNGYQATVLYQKGQGQNPSMPQIPGNMEDILAGMMGGFSGFSGFGAMGGMPQTQGAELFALEGETLLTVTEQQTMTLTVPLDQRDIAKVTLGQTAQVKINALKGRTFEAEVTQVGSVGVNNGGSSKFTLELTLPKEADMLPGMSAAVYLPLYTRKNVLTLPVAALTDREGKTLVYTAQDPETGEPAAPVEVEVGVSDGLRAEILSGLASGDVCYYSYYDILELSTDVETEKFTFGG